MGETQVLDHLVDATFIQGQVYKNVYPKVARQLVITTPTVEATNLDFLHLFRNWV